MDAGGGKAGGVKSDINVTPLVDIVLVLLIIFIVITPAVNSSVKLPTAKHSPKAEKNKDEKYLTLMLTSKRNDKWEVIGPGAILIDDKDAKDLTFFINNEGQRQQLEDFINRNVSQLSQKVVFVKADADLPFKYVNELFQVCRKGGADEASIVTSEDKTEEKPAGGK
ncbi:MAG: biopolymer transporter ExbD [Geothrix sp.]|uniref:ExbD/TolR family protein n=1 Tax=Geothrix sp. TaxID=1962974 RepID=UPI0017AF5A8B|nr:biopolymer transporter ExbD [Geothrix sp.]NWJ42322.1 biopolymer transporter ExbD [Geothrix sp.]WIL19710.1 MAG: biopolymer transporter ExbD [Geothrix sp.]